MHISACVYSILCVLCLCFTSGSCLPYTVLIDAGSSGSRVRVYHQVDDARHLEPGSLQEIFALKKTPGLSAIDVDNMRGAEDYLAELIQAASQNVPEYHHHSTEIYVMATAGECPRNDRK